MTKPGRDPKRIWSSRGCFLQCLKRPDISILSDDFLAEVSRLPQKNLAVEFLRKLLSDEIKQFVEKRSPRLSFRALTLSF
jgi:uncharacterized protein YfaA (DUF2138 family)